MLVITIGYNQTYEPFQQEMEGFGHLKSSLQVADLRAEVKRLQDVGLNMTMVI